MIYRTRAGLPLLLCALARRSVAYVAFLAASLIVLAGGCNCHGDARVGDSGKGKAASPDKLDSDEKVPGTVSTSIEMISIRQAVDYYNRAMGTGAGILFEADNTGNSSIAMNEPLDWLIETGKQTYVVKDWKSIESYLRTKKPAVIDIVAHSGNRDRCILHSSKYPEDDITRANGKIVGEAFRDVDPNLRLISLSVCNLGLWGVMSRSTVQQLADGSKVPVISPAGFAHRGLQDPESGRAKASLVKVTKDHDPNRAFLDYRPDLKALGYPNSRNDVFYISPSYDAAYDSGVIFLREVT